MRGVVVLLAALVAASVAGAAAPLPLRGAFQSKRPTEIPPLDGTWRIEIALTGAYKVSRDGKVLVTGKAVETAKTISFTKEKGSLACTGKEGGANSYRWALSGTRLTFTAVKDPCGSRKLVLTTKPFTRTR